MRQLLASLIATTTYGTWLPGDTRGYVEKGRLLPPSPILECHASTLMQREPVVLSRSEQERAVQALLTASHKYGYRLHAVSVERWYAHWVVSHGGDSIEVMVGRLKTAMRQAIGRGRIWSRGYDARYCMTEDEVRTRMAYVQRHTGHRPVEVIL